MTEQVSRRGVVYLVGAGPGDVGLITVRGRELLEACDAIVFDALANPELVARATDRGAESFDVGKRGAAAESTPQEEITTLLVSLARAGKRVVRLKGGDPFVFGRGSEEAQALAAAAIDFEIVPGVTAGIAAPAYAGIPVTHRGLATSVTFVTGHEDPSKPETQIDWHALAKVGASGTIVLYMGMKTLPAIVAELTRGGLSATTPAAAIQWGTHAGQRTVVATLGTIADRAKVDGLTAPVITIVGPTVALRDEIAWFERRPLFGTRIAVTRATATAGTLATRLRALGADVLEAPTTTIEPLDPSTIAASIGRLGQASVVVFTSATAVRVFWDALLTAGLDARAFSRKRVAVLGPATADALRDRGIVADLVPSRFVAESLLEAMVSAPWLKDAAVFYATAEGARDVLPNGLRAAGATVDVAPIYRSVPNEAAGERLRAAIDSNGLDLVTFAAASAVEGYVGLVGQPRASRIPGASIGPITTEAMRKHAIPLKIEAPMATIDALIRAILTSS